MSNGKKVLPQGTLRVFGLQPIKIPCFNTEYIVLKGIHILLLRKVVITSRHKCK